MIPFSAPSPMPDIATPAAVSPSCTYRLDATRKHIVGKVEGVQAITQMIYKTLSTERYAWLIYNWNHGTELEQYVGMPSAYIKADLERAITEALLADDRILELKDFQFRNEAVDALAIEFVAVTTEGYIKITQEVPLL